MLGKGSKKVKQRPDLLGAIKAKAGVASLGSVVVLQLASVSLGQDPMEF